jgi:hypothetical protein
MEVAQIRGSGEQIVEGNRHAETLAAGLWRGKHARRQSGRNR